MLNQDSNADTQQDDAAEQFRADFPVNGISKADADGKAQQTHAKGNKADEHQRYRQLRQRVVPRTSIGDTHCQGVDAGCHRQNELRVQIPGIDGLIDLFLK